MCLLLASCSLSSYLLSIKIFNWFVYDVLLMGTFFVIIIKVKTMSLGVRSHHHHQRILKVLLMNALPIDTL